MISQPAFLRNVKEKTVPNVEQRSMHSLKMPLATLPFRYARKTSGVEL